MWVGGGGGGENVWVGGGGEGKRMPSSSQVKKIVSSSPQYYCV